MLALSSIALYLVVRAYRAVVVFGQDFDEVAMAAALWEKAQRTMREGCAI